MVTKKAVVESDIDDYINKPILSPQKEKTATDKKDVIKSINELLDKQLVFWKSLNFKEIKRYELGRELLISGDKEEYKWVLMETPEGFKKMLVYKAVPYKKKDGSRAFMMSLRTKFYDTTSKTSYDVWNMLVNPASPLKASIRKKVEA